MDWLLFALGAILLLLIVSGGYVFFTACGKKKDIAWMDDEALSKTSYAKYGNLIKNSNRWLHDHDAQPVNVKSFDGTLLHGLWIPAENPRGTILLAHGYRSTRLVDFGKVYSIYHEKGMNILVPEQRCHGNSSGKYITFGVKESRDMVCWIEYINHNLTDLPMLISGLSMGASTMLYLADQELPDNVKGIIADCGFTSPKAIISKVFTDVTHLPAGPVIFVTDLFARIFAGFSLDERDTRRSLANARLPVLLVHGESDDFVPCSMSVEAYNACTGPKELLTAPGAGHGLSFLFVQEQYTRLVTEFLDTYIGEEK